MANNTAKDFSVGKMSRNILSQSVPLIVANLVHLLYNVVDRIYIGHLPGIGSLALTGIGLAFPLTTLIAAFTNLFATGGTPLFSIARGQRNEERAEKIIGQVFFWLILLSVILFTLCYTFKKPILYAFGASDESFSFANDYFWRPHASCKVLERAVCFGCRRNTVVVSNWRCRSDVLLLFHQKH